jgi:hypothetical protein
VVYVEPGHHRFAMDVNAHWAAQPLGHLDHRRAPEPAQARSTALGAEMTAHRLSSSVPSSPMGALAFAARKRALHPHSNADMRSRMDGGDPGMEMMLDVMLEDSNYLDKCAERHRSWTGATNFAISKSARFERFDDGSAFGGGGEDGVWGSRRMVELADHLALTAPADVRVEDMLLFDEFVGQGGEATATASTLNILFRSMQGELESKGAFQLTSSMLCCFEDDGQKLARLKGVEASRS